MKLSSNEPQRRRLMWLSVAAFLALALWMTVGLCVVDSLTSRRHRRFDEPLPSSLLSRGESLRVQASDGEDLGAWFVAGRVDRPAVVLLHGNGGCRSACLREIEFLVSEGCSVLALTVRVHGDSSGERNDFGYSARLDVIAAVRELKRRLPEHRVLVWGGSLGAAAATFASQELGNEVSAYLLDAPYRDIETAVRQRLEMKLPGPCVTVTWWTMRLAANWLLPHWPEIAPTAAAKFPPDVAVTIVTGTADRRATVAEARELATVIGPSASLQVVPDADHLQTFHIAPEIYRNWLHSNSEPSSSPPLR